MATGIKDKVAILGMGCSKFGERWDASPEDLMLEAYNEAMADAGIGSGPGFDGVGIREAVEALTGARPRESVAEAIAFSTRRYAKRQETWFRHQVPEPRLNFDATRPAEALADDIAAAWSRDQA